MQTAQLLKTACLVTALSLTGWATSRAQTATWIGPNLGSEWNTAADWDLLVVPGASTNALIGAGTNISYNTPMTAASFGILTNSGILAVNAAGFNCSTIIMLVPQGGDRLYLTNGTAPGAVNVTGNFDLGTNASATMIAGTSLTVGGSLNVDFSSSSHASGTATFTNSGGTLTANNTTINNGSGTGNGLLVISGGVSQLGNVSIGRYGTTSASTLGTEGLAVYGGVVSMTNLNVGGGYSASFETAYIDGGIVTNYGSMYLNGATAARYGRFVQSAGLFVMPDPGVVNPNSTTAGAVTAEYIVNAGATNIVGGFMFGATNPAAAATYTFTDSGNIYVGSAGMNSNGVILLTASLNSGAKLGATANWTGSTTMTLGSGSSPFTIQAADPGGNPWNITLNNPLNGGNVLNKTGGGTLTLNAANGYSGNTLINGGTLALGASGSLASPVVIVGPESTFDVSSYASGFVLNNETLEGLGSITGAVIVASGAAVSPGSNSLTGTLTFNSSLTETNGGAINYFTLAGAPNPNNDLIIVNGDLNASGTNYMNITGSALVPGTNYTLVQYGGNFNGNITNFVVETAIGTLSNNATAKTILFIPQATLRAPTNTVWIGNPVNTNWDNEISTNWLNGSTLDYFVTSDSVNFTDLGASNTPVNIIGTVQPGSILVNSHSNYVIASTSGGWIAGSTGLTVSNSGTLTLLTTNTYAGNTIVDGGSTLSVAQVNNAGDPSSIGEGNLIINNGTFSYTGPGNNVNLGSTLGNANSAINISANGNLTLTGIVGGNGGLTMEGAGTLFLDGSSTYSGVTTLSSGTLEVNGTGALGTNAVNFEGGTLSFASQSAQNFFVNTFDVVTSGEMYFHGANADNIIGDSGGHGGLTGNGILSIDVTNSGVYCTINLDIESFAGTFLLTGDSSGYFRLNSGGGLGAQICNGSTNATFNLGSGSGQLINRNGGGTGFDVYDLGALEGGTDTYVRGAASVNSASIYSIGANNLSTVFSGTITNGTGGNEATTGIIKVGTGTLTLLGQNNYTGPTTISNGVLALANNPATGNDGSIGSSANIIITAGGILDVTGETQHPGTLLVGSQVLSGNGTIRGALDTYTLGAGTVAPGDGLSGNLGTLTATNTISLGGTLWMKINRSATPNSDQLVSSLSYTYCAGTLVVTNVGPPLQVGDTFTLLRGHSFDGTTFSTFVLPGYYAWDTNGITTNGTIKVVGVLPLPKVTRADFSALSGGAVTLYSTNGFPNTSVNILTSTNLALPLNRWTVVTNTLFDNNGDLTDPNTGNPGLTIYINQTNSTSFFQMQTLGY